jgi:mannose-6-phosphate isomerase class I
MPVGPIRSNTVPTASHAGQLPRRIAAGVIKPLRNNLVERPWGGTRIRAFKGLCPLEAQPEIGGSGLGESFEIAAFDNDPEARQYPSIVHGDEGERLALPELLAAHGEALLGRAWTQAHGPRVPLLPKFLNVRELLSVQGHPAGHTEVYVVAEAERGASIRLGFRRDMDRNELRQELQAGLEAQQALGSLLQRDVPWAELQAPLRDWFADKSVGVGDVLGHFVGHVSASRHVDRLSELLASLKRHYWFVLDAMNEIHLHAGMVIHNANPARITALTGKAPAAEVHALGNPQRREFIALEIRRPGPTLRAWDNVRFPMRAVDINAALDALNLRATTPDDFIVKPLPVAGQPGMYRSVRSAYFNIDHLYPKPTQAVTVESHVPHCLHVVGGAVELRGDDGAVLETLTRGESAMIVEPLHRYTLAALAEDAHVVRVELP